MCYNISVNQVNNLQTLTFRGRRLFFMPNIKTFEPSWKKFEKNIKNSLQAGIAFDEIRADEMKKDPIARRWETSRKQAYLSEKKHFIKQISQQEQEEKNKLLTKYLKGGFLMNKLKPSPGFILTKPLTKQEEKKTETGIYLAENEIGRAHV